MKIAGGTRQQCRVISDSSSGQLCQKDKFIFSTFAFFRPRYLSVNHELLRSGNHSRIAGAWLVTFVDKVTQSAFS